MLKRFAGILVVALLGLGITGMLGHAQEGPPIATDKGVQAVVEQIKQEAATQTQAPAPSPAPQPEKTAVPSQKDNNVTLDFKDADIQNVLRVLAYKSGVNIVTGKEVTGTVTIRLVDVPWEQALAVILSTYGFAYEREGNIITVSTVEGLKTRREKQKELSEIEGVASKVFTLQFLDASDAKKMLEPQLSPQGKISVLEVTGQKGWEFGVPAAGQSSEQAGKVSRERQSSRSRALVITDTPSYIDRISKILLSIDVKPNQILIEARIMEVNRDTLKDLGLEWSTGSRLETHSGDRTGGQNLRAPGFTGTVTGRNYSTTEPTAALQLVPSNFLTKATNLSPTNAGIEILFHKLLGMQMEAMIRALEEDVRTNTLSAPRVLTLSGQEAVIMVGEKYPILETNVSGTAGTTTTTLAYYQDIGIQLYVVPQISGDEKFVNMIIHPVVSSFTQTVGTNAYPRLVTREAETQILMSDGETIVIGGLLKDVKSKSKIGIPILSDIPIFGGLFTRQTTNVSKIDLLIFITARVIKPGELSDQDIAMIKQAMDAGQPNISLEKAPVKDGKKDKKKPNAAAPAEGFSKSNNKGFLKK